MRGGGRQKDRKRRIVERDGRRRGGVGEREENERWIKEIGGICVIQ